MFFACNEESSTSTTLKNQLKTTVIVKQSDSLIYVYYKGPEFLNDVDTAHRISNLTAHLVGEQLKQNFEKGHYSKVDFQRSFVKVSGKARFEFPSEEIVHYTLYFPIQKVKTKREAFTGFEHRGTWVGNEIDEDFQEWKKRMNASISVGKTEEFLYQSEGAFREYWLQFQHVDYQKDLKLKCF